MWRRVISLGFSASPSTHEQPVSASKLKIIGNALILGQIELLAEMMTLADKAEVGAANVSTLCILWRRGAYAAPHSSTT